MKINSTFGVSGKYILIILLLYAQRQINITLINKKDHAGICDWANLLGCGRYD